MSVKRYIGTELEYSDQKLLWQGKEMSDKESSTKNNLTAQGFMSGNGKHYCPYQYYNSGTGNASGHNKDSIRCIPFFLSRKVRVEEMSVYLASGGNGGSAKFRFGLYKARDADLYPSERIFETVEVTQAASAMSYIRQNMDLVLDAGVYYTALWHNAATAIVWRGIPSSAQRIVLGYSPGSSTPISRVEKTLTYDSNGFPATFPGSASQANGSGFSPEFVTLKTSPV